MHAEIQKFYSEEANPMKILIADDNRVDRNLLNGLLKKMGYQVNYQAINDLVFFNLAWKFPFSEPYARLLEVSNFELI